MPDAIDYKFICDREGGRRTKAYVPEPDTSDSGVTVATGFDLGARSEIDLNRLGLGLGLIAKLKPYLGKKKKDAVDALKKAPLTVSLLEAEQIDRASFASHVSDLGAAYDAAVGTDRTKKKFEDLPSEAQTVIASVAFQYGRLSRRAPKFWKAAVSQDWKETVKILRSFEDKYAPRRNLEADVLQKIVP